MEGICVHVKKHNTPQGTPFRVNTQVLWNQPPDFTTLKGLKIRRKMSYYDVSIEGISGETVTVEITNDIVDSETVMQYWHKEEWLDVENRLVVDHTISGDIPVSALLGKPPKRTPISIGT